MDLIDAWGEVSLAYRNGHLSEDAYVTLYNAIRDKEHDD
jgi:hypothetical protein